MIPPLLASTPHQNSRSKAYLNLLLEKYLPSGYESTGCWARCNQDELSILYFKTQHGEVDEWGVQGDCGGTLKKFDQMVRRQNGAGGWCYFWYCDRDGCCEGGGREGGGWGVVKTSAGNWLCFEVRGEAEAHEWEFKSWEVVCDGVGCWKIGVVGWKVIDMKRDIKKFDWQLLHPESEHKDFVTVVQPHGINVPPVSERVSTE